MCSILGVKGLRKINILYRIFVYLCRFQVKYTVTNTERDDGNVSLVWSPVDNASLKTLRNAPIIHSLVCLQPKVKIG